MKFTAKTTMNDIMTMSDREWVESINLDPIIRSSNENCLTIEPKFDPYDTYMQDQIEDLSIINEAMKVHSDKRYNRKYINSRKHLIKDKKVLFSKKGARVYDLIDLEKGLSKVLFDKNVIRNDNDNVKIISESSKIEWITPVRVHINYKRKSFFYSWSNINTIRGLFIIHNNKESDSITLESLTEKESYSNNNRMITIRNSDIEYIDLREMNHISYSRRVGFDIYSEDLDYHWNRKYFFYGKPVYGKFFCKGIFIGITDKKEDSYWYHDTLRRKSRIAKKVAVEDLRLGLIEYRDQLIEKNNFRFEDYDDFNYGYNHDCLYVSTYYEPLNYWETDIIVPDTLEEIKSDIIDQDLDLCYGYDDDWLWDD